VQRLREFGWIESRNLTIEYRYAEGRSERYAELAAEFVREGRGRVWLRLPNKRHGLANSGVPSRKNVFLGRAEERRLRCLCWLPGPIFNPEAARLYITLLGKIVFIAPQF